MRFKVFYLDSDGSFTPHRLEHLSVKDEVAERIVVFRTEDCRDQVRITETLETLLTKAPTLLVVDSITGLYRAAFRRRTEVFAYNRELNRELAYLADLARRFELGTLLTGEVHSQPGLGEWSVEPVATRTMRHWSRLILRIRPTPRQNVRECLLEKIDGREVSGPRCLFRISETGVEDA
jgi:DNA repair protein RadA